MEQSVALIEKYKARLESRNDLKKVHRALQKLNEIEMTKELIQITGIGNIVSDLRKTRGVEDLAKKIVRKWKKVADNPDSDTKVKSNLRLKKPAPEVKSEATEYDPAQNWKVKKRTAPHPSLNREQVKSEEYDPSKNWKVKTSRVYPALCSSPEIPGKIAKEKQLIDKSRKRKGDLKEITEKVDKKAARLDREAELLATLQRTQDELRKMKQEMTVSKTRVKQQHTDRATEESVLPQEATDFEEYDPGHGDQSLSYQPSVTSDTKPIWGNEHGNDSEASFEEPGSYLLHQRFANSDHDLSNEESDGAQDCFVQSTTLYSRNKSVDSEDGMWGSKVDGVREKQDVKSFKSMKSAKGSTNTSSEESDESTTSDKKSKNSVKSAGVSSLKGNVTFGTKTPEIKSEKCSENENLKSKKKSMKKGIMKSGKDETPKIKVESAKESEASERRKLTKKVKEPNRKKMKNSKAVNPKIKEAGFLFEDLPNVSSKHAKKKKKAVKTMEITPTPKPAPKYNLHLPEAQAAYRPLPRFGGEKTLNKPKSVDEPLTDNQAAELHSKRQTTKMLVYSGRGGGVLPKMMSLYDQCMAVLMNNIDAIESFGGIPYEIVQPILKKCTPDQLYRLEGSSPYLLDDTASLWEQHAIQEFRGKKPDEMESWREMYLRLSDEREAKLRCLTLKIRAKEAKKKPLEKKVMLAYVGANAKPPRSVRRAQERNGTVRLYSSSVPSTSSRSTSSSVRRDITDARRSVAIGTITAATVDREDRIRQMRETKKPRVAPMMAKTLQTIGKLRFKR